MMLPFSPRKRWPCPCSDAVLRSCEEALAGIILHRPPSLWFAWVRSGCPGCWEQGPPGAGAGDRWGGGGIREHVLHVFSAQSDSCAITFSTDALRLPVSMQSDEVQTIECFSQLLLVALIRAPPRTEPVCVVEVDNRFRAREVSGGDARNKLQITAPAKHKPPKKQP